MKRFFTELKDGIIVAGGEEAHHIIHVMRMKAGDRFIACIGDEREFLAEINGISKDTVTAKIVEARVSVSESEVKVTIFQGLPKGDKLELIIQKAVELGAYEIVPVTAKRSVVKIEEKKVKAKCERWNKISASAAKQSGRGIIPEVSAPVSVSKAAELMRSFDLAIVAYEMEEETTLKKVLKSHKTAKSIGVFIGPEGGIDETEFELLKQSGAVSVTLGERILRTETAPLAVLSMITYEFEEE